MSWSAVLVVVVVVGVLFAPSREATIRLCAILAAWRRGVEDPNLGGDADTPAPIAPSDGEPS